MRDGCRGAAGAASLTSGALIFSLKFQQKSFASNWERWRAEGCKRSISVVHLCSSSVQIDWPAESEDDQE